jgi:CheY-like chemotaxis protein
MTETKPLIMVVDDDQDFVEINRHILEAAGFCVVSAAGPDEAWRRLDQQKPDLVITDLMMEGLDSGFAFSRRLKEDPRFHDVPIIIATSVTSQLGFDFHPQSDEELAAMNVNAYFDKPVPPKRLLEKVKELLKTRS